MSEVDWRLFRELRPIALERFCQRVLSEVVRLASDAAKTGHDRYLGVFELIEQRDKELADAFDAPRRSTALRQLACIRSRALLTEEEFARFRPETRDAVQLFLGVRQG